MNKQKLLNGLAVAALAAFVAMPASSDEEQQLSRVISSETSALADAMNVELGAMEREAGDEMWHLGRIRLRAQAKVGVEVPWLSKLEIVPEIELLWQREKPEGWTTYKP